MLKKTEIHLWRIPLERSEAEIATLKACLSPDELKRAEGIRLGGALRRFIVSHGELRQLLGRYLDTDPASLQFVENAHGKPSLVGAPADTGLKFNMAHSDELAVVALCLEHEVGVDIERSRTDRDLDRIVKRFFAPPEIVEYERLRKSQRVEGFFNGWTRKEAFIKAIGDGLRHPLDSFVISLTPGVAPRLLSVNDDPDEATKWQMKSFDPAPGYIGAVAVRALDIDVVLCRN